MATQVVHMSAADAVRTRCLYTSASANRQSQIVDWARHPDGTGTLVYGSNKSVVVARDIGTLHPPPSHLLVTPNGVLTVVKFAYPLRSSHNVAPKIVAGSADGYLYLFTQDAPSASGWRLQQQWRASSQQQQQQQHTASRKSASTIPGRKAKQEAAPSVRALGVLRSSPASAATNDEDGDEYTFASATSDGIIRIWSVQGSGDVREIQVLSLGHARAETLTEVLPLDIAMARLPSATGRSPSSPLLMTVAGTDSKIDVLLAEEGTLTFRKLFSLLGHADWVRSLDLCDASSESGSCLMLASGSQDHGVRLWRIEAASVEDDAQEEALRKPLEEMDEFEKLASRIEDGQDEAIATKMQSFRCGLTRWNISFDALLVGHEHWVTGVRWAPAHGDGQPAALLTSSADNSVFLWTPSSAVERAVSEISLPTFSSALVRKHIESKEQDVWVALQRFGELGNVGSAANGMYGVAWDPTCGRPGATRQAVLGHGYGGAVHIWSRSVDQDRVLPWTAQPGLGGHFAPVMTACWEPGGQFFLSGGADKTTRLHGCHRDEGQRSSWHEIARPQTHGFEIVCLAWLSRLAFVSAGDEKVLRVFEAPQGFVHSAESLNLVTASEMANVLIFALPSLEHLLHPEHLTKPIKEATRQSLTKGRLDIVAVSPLFDGIEAGAAPHLTFAQAETFLKWCYAMAWATAVEADELLLDVDVILMGTKMAAFKFGQQRKAATLFVVKDNAINVQLPHVSQAVVLSADMAAQRMDGFTLEEANDFPQHEAIAMGGTFDHLHVGHKILLSMSCLLATRRVVVGVTDESMLAKKKNADLLESTQERIDRVARFMSKFCQAIGRTSLQHDVVVLRDVAGPAGTDADLSALLFTDETVGGADFIDGEREKRGLAKLARYAIGVIGASGETDVQGKDASELAAAKVGSTAIRGWLAKRQASLTESPAQRQPAINHVPTLTGEPRPVGASVPPLGLSNRAIYDTIHGVRNEPQDGPSLSGQPIGKAIRSIASHLSRPPVEEQLHNHSLWSEVTKLYGHSLELLSLDVDRTSGLIASSCKANHAELAGIRLHDSRHAWKEVQVLMGHALGVTRVRFSADGTLLVSVSRDRSWRLFERRRSSLNEVNDATSDAQGPFILLAVFEEAHTRVIFDVAWCGDTHFATASRDGSVKVWQVQRESKTAHCVSTLSHDKQCITAVAATDGKATTGTLLAVGSETGHVWLYRARLRENAAWQLVCTLENLHAEALNELAWQPVTSAKHTVILASAGNDGAVRLTEVSR